MICVVRCDAAVRVAVFVGRGDGIARHRYDHFRTCTVSEIFFRHKRGYHKSRILPVLSVDGGCEKPRDMRHEA